MFHALLTIAISVGTKLLTEKFLTRLAVILLEKLAKSTDNTLDDKIMKEVKDALGWE